MNDIIKKEMDEDKSRKKTNLFRRKLGKYLRAESAIAFHRGKSIKKEEKAKMKLKILSIKG